MLVKHKTIVFEKFKLPDPIWLTKNLYFSYMRFGKYFVEEKFKTFFSLIVTSGLFKVQIIKLIICND